MKCTKVKRKAISDAGKKTRAKRRSQVAFTLETKINQSRTTKTQDEYLKNVFKEAKWIWNYLAAESKKAYENEGYVFDVFKLRSRYLKEVVHKDKNKNDIVSPIEYLAASSVDNVIGSFRNSIKGLSTLKKKGHKVGQLKFKSEYNSIGFNQYGITHKVEGNKIKLAGCKKWFPVNGLKHLDKIPLEPEITTAKLVRKPDGYYIVFCVFFDRVEYNNWLNRNKNIKSEYVAIDFGCETSFVLSDGGYADVQIGESERIKRLQRKLKRKEKGSNNWYKTRKLLRVEHQKLSNKKKDTAKQLVRELLNEYETIIIQDENLSGWQKSRHGKKVSHSIMGRVKAELIKSDMVHLINKFVPTSKLCYNCGYINDELSLWNRVYICPNCGVIYDEDGKRSRDVHAAQNMLFLYLNFKDKIGLDGSEFKRSDFEDALGKYFSDKQIQRLNSETVRPGLTQCHKEKRKSFE